MAMTPERDPSPPLRAPKPEDIDAGLGSIGRGLRSGLVGAGEIGVFTMEVIRDLPDMFRRDVPEVFKQAGILILSSALIIWFMMLIMGAECGLEASYTLRQIGAPLYSGTFDAYCGLRELSVYMWGWILAAKVGCGFVAELGSMRISDEIDALDVIGVKSRSYLVGTRMAATLMAAPFMYVVGLGILYVSEYLVTVVDLKDVSSGGYQYIFWIYQSPSDFLGALLKVLTETLAIAGVGLYYGFTATGGPVGVGRATAKSMILNLVLISLIGTIGTAAWWGLSTNAPIAN